MRAAFLESGPGALLVDEVQVDAVGPREVLVRTVAAGLCHSDLHFVEGRFPYIYPAILGHESAGVVEAVGSDVTDFVVGDHVIACASGFCGACRWCLTGRPFLCERPGLGRAPGAAPRLSRNGQPVYALFDIGGFGELLLLHEHFLVKVRPEMPLDKAALIGCAVMTGVGAVLHTAGVRPGDTVAVIGCGGVGLNAVQGAAIAGADRIVAVDRVASKLDLARTFGATDVVDTTRDDAVQAVAELTRGGVDHAFEAIGLKATAEQAFRMVNKAGTATLIGVLPLGQTLEIDPTQLFAGKRLQGSTMGSNRFRIDMPRLVDWYLAGRLKLDELVSGSMPLERINEGFAAMGSGEIARQLVVFDT
jgi:S-(hydroxymethyl)glutathione dehydrogenase/alcohol dehydrogenase